MEAIIGKPKAPDVPDPMETSAAATGTNVSTAIANTMMGQVGQVGPGGSLSYDQTGSYSYTDPYTGESYDIPQFTATQTMSPEMQGIYSGMTSRMNDVVGSLGGDYNMADAEAQLMEMGQQRISPILERDRAALESRLANQGLNPGSAAWEAEMSGFNNRSNDAYNQLALSGRGQAFGEMMAMRQAPINEISALLSGQQMAAPNYQTATPTGIPTTDNAGLINNAYNQEFGNYESAMGTWNDTMGGLFGLGKAAIAASDCRLKKDIIKIGENSGLNVYEYRYKWEPDTAPLRRGYMAQEIIKVIPEAVVRLGEYMALKYSMLPELK